MLFKLLPRRDSSLPGKESVEHGARVSLGVSASDERAFVHAPSRVVFC